MASQTDKTWTAFEEQQSVEVTARLTLGNRAGRTEFHASPSAWQIVGWQLMILFAWSFPSLTFAQTELIPIERIEWESDWDHALDQAQRQSKPLLVVAKDALGEKTRLGRLMQPTLLVEAANSLFVPVALSRTSFQSISKADGQLSMAGQAMCRDTNDVWWVVNSSGTNLVSQMVKAAAATRKDDSTRNRMDRHRYLELLAQELDQKRETASFAMHCFWQGEIDFGQVPGVVKTAAYQWRGQEMVKVTFLPESCSFESLVRRAFRLKCADAVFPQTKDHKRIVERLARGAVVEARQVIDSGETNLIQLSKPSDQKYYLRLSLYRWLPLLETQKVKINSALGMRQPPDLWLSPAQRQIYKALNKRWLNDSDYLHEVRQKQKTLGDRDYFRFLQAEAYQAMGKEMMSKETIGKTE